MSEVNQPPIALPRGFNHLTISSGVRSAALRTPDKVVLVFEGQRVSYAELIERCNRVANAGSEDGGLQFGDHVAILAPNCLEYIEIVCGISDLGCALVTPSPSLASAELTAILNDAKVRLLFVHPSCAAKIDQAKIKTLEQVIVINADYHAWLSAASEEFTPPDITEWTPFAIPYTSGTTGKPKGVVLSHRSRTLGFHGNAVEYGIYGPSDYFYAIAPLCHGAGLAFAMSSIFFGGTCEIAPKFDPERVLTVLHKGNVTGIFMVPTHFHAIFELDPSILNENRGHNLTAILSNASALPQATKEKIVDYFGAGVLFELYGSTEAGVVSSLPPADQLRKEQCVGLPFPNTRIALLDGKGQPVGVGEIGELYSKSPYLFNGYWQRDNETDAAYRDGWVSVGDLARQDEEGYLYIVGRKTEMIISGGINIYPREIEEVLAEHPSIKEVAVIGAPDQRWGEKLVAYVVCTNNETLNTDALQDYCRDKLAGYKTPREIHTTDALPRNAGGKVLKHELMARYELSLAV